jgi:LDH2 family malate/lactate/ureidoglycolate dehydrogenase
MAAGLARRDAKGRNGMSLRPDRFVAVDDLRGLMERLLAAAGVGAVDARAAAEVFVEADLRGNHRQGLDHMRTMLRNLRSGNADPGGVPRVVREGPAFALIDGGRGPGQIAALMAADLAVEKARAAGCGAVGVTGSGDIYMVGYYAERIARAGCVGFAFSNSAPTVRAHGGVEPTLGTNPLAIALPTAGPHPIVHDMATSAFSGSSIRFAAFRGERLPEGAGVGADGRLTGDPERVREGAISPLAGHKGFGLGLFVAFLCGPLTGSDVGRALRGWGWKEWVPGRAGVMGHLLIAVDPAAFGDAGRFRGAVQAYAEAIKASRAAPGSPGVRMPGEGAFAERARNLAAGRVPIPSFVWDDASAVAKELGVAMPPAA